MNKGIEFEKQVKIYLEDKFSTEFKSAKFKIGNPAKEHKFDLVSEVQKIIIECKCYKWRKKNKVPCAKISTLNEAVLFMQNINPPYDKYLKVIILKKEYNSDKKKTLAQYYHDTYGCLAKDIEIVEIDNLNNIGFIKGKHLKNILNNTSKNCTL